MKNDTVLTSGEYLVDPETKDWLDRVCRTIHEAVGDRPKMRMYPYRKDGCNYLALDFDERDTGSSGRSGRWFSLTIAMVPYGKNSLDYPEIGCNDLSVTILDSFDAITIAAHIASRLKAEVAFNLPVPTMER
jgi:hypothetical protein